MQKCKIHKRVFYIILLLLKTNIGLTILTLIKTHFELFKVNTHLTKMAGPNGTKQQFM
jgi:ABC-type sugar transport system permease subunit